MNKIDFQGLAGALIAQAPGILFSWFPAGKLHGNEFRIGNIAGDAGESLSINIRTGKWADFASEMSGGDLISVYAMHKGIKMGEAAAILGGVDAPIAKIRDLPPDLIEPLVEAPDDVYVPLHPKFGKCDLFWFYRNKSGKIVGCVTRYDFPDKKKEFFPWKWNGLKWVCKSFPKPRILYGLEMLKPGPVLIVEGEKAADAARRLLPEYSVVSWPGGAGAVKYADFATLKNKGYSEIVIWPDDDDAGRKAARYIRDFLGRGYIIPNSGDSGWDAADAESEGCSLEFIKPKESEPNYPDYGEPAHEPDEKGNFFRVLGYDGDEFFFYSYLSKQVHGISRGSLTNTASLLQLAPLHWWQSMGMVSDRGGIETTNAVNMLISKCFHAGLFNPNNCRGAGAWDDAGRCVLHVGDKLIVNGQMMNLSDFESNYIYERRHSTGIEYGESLETSEAKKLLDICKLIRWEDSISAELLAGWIVIAPICGALLHRPHLYIIGPATSGKSWVIENIIQGILGKTAFVTASKTTAAGIRQNMRSDALPVIFDEAEAENMPDRLRLQEVFDMARVSFNGDAAPIHKGTADQTGRSYSPRSCFCFGSINQSMTRNPDETRTSILKIMTPSKDAQQEREKFLKLEKLATEVITSRWRGGLLSRTVNLIPVIKANARTFSDAAASYFSSRRQGDQLGPILAGLYTLHSAGLIKRENALSFIERQTWTQQKEIIEDSSHLRLWHFLMESIVEFDSMGAGNKKATVSELLDVVGLRDNSICSFAAAERALRNAGFMLQDDMILVSNTALWIKSKLNNTEWPGKWSHALKCLDGAVISTTPKRFASGVSQYVAVPIGLK